MEVSIVMGDPLYRCLVSKKENPSMDDLDRFRVIPMTQDDSGNLHVAASITTSYFDVNYIREQLGTRFRLPISLQAYPNNEQYCPVLAVPGLLIRCPNQHS